eukprot:g4130.t1
MQGNGNERTTLRVIQVTDVYKLKWFPHLKTCIDAKRAEISKKNGGTTVTMLTGDFLAPYLLSSIDKGKGMVNCLNKAGIDILTWGNHDLNDLHLKDVIQREREYKGILINTNLWDHPSVKGSQCQKRYHCVEATSVSGTNKRKIGFMGILTDQKGLFRKCVPPVKPEDPWKTMETYSKLLKEKENCDIAVPLCHLYERQDEKTCKEFDFPIVLSGHDHHVVDRVIEGTRLLKPGSDARKAWVIDFVWENATAAAVPKINCELVDITSYAPDKDLQSLVEKCMKPLDRLNKAQIAIIGSHYRPLFSTFSRGIPGCVEARLKAGPSTMQTFLLNKIRDSLNLVDDENSHLKYIKAGEKTVSADHVDCCIAKGGWIRGDDVYSDDDQMTMGILKSELKDDSEIFIFEAKGSVLEDCIVHSWKKLSPGWFHHCDAVELDPQTGLIVKIAGKALDHDKIYRVASFLDFAREDDSPRLGSWIRKNNCDTAKLHPDSGIPAPYLLLQLFARIAWTKIWHTLDKNKNYEIDTKEFAKIDTNGDGKVDAKEMLTMINKICGFSSYEFLNVLMDIAGDIDDDDKIDLNEMNKAYKNMKCLVGVKRVIDYAVKVRVKPDKLGVELNNVKMSMNPFCEIAVEEAVRLKESKKVDEIIAVSVGPKSSAETLRTALAMGADRAYHIETELRHDQDLQPLAVAKALKHVVEKESPELVICGKQSIDDDLNHTAQMLAGLLGWPQATFTSELEVASDSQLNVTREVDGGLQKVECKIPCVISADLRLNEPRYATLPNIMKAKKKPLETLKLDDLGFDASPRFKVTKVEDPPVREAGKKVDDVDSLISSLKDEAGVI